MDDEPFGRGTHVIKWIAGNERQGRPADVVQVNDIGRIDDLRRFDDVIKPAFQRRQGNHIIFMKAAEVSKEGVAVSRQGHVTFPAG